MENQIKVQELNENESCMELTAEELAELETLKGGNSLLSSASSLYTVKLFPYGIVWDIFQSQIPQASQISQIKSTLG